MSTNTNEINGLPLPETLAAGLQSGIWRTPTNVQVWRSILPNEMARHAMLYNLKRMETENTYWRGQSAPSYLGQADKQRPPGDIDPAKSLLIADLGPDKMIALDYRESLDRPSVLYIKDYPDGSTRWIKIAPDIETFIRALGLEAVETRTG